MCVWGGGDSGLPSACISVAVAGLLRCWQLAAVTSFALAPLPALPAPYLLWCRRSPTWLSLFLCPCRGRALPLGQRQQLRLLTAPPMELVRGCLRGVWRP